MARPVRVEPTLTRTDLARRLAPEVGSFSGADRFIADMFEALGDELAAGGIVKIHGLGVFRCLEKKARKGRNPRTGKAAQISPRRVVSFVGGAKLKKMVASGETGPDGTGADEAELDETGPDGTESEGPDGSGDE